MYNISLKEGSHNWEKQNLVTIIKGGKSYDEMKCSGCGMQGKTHRLTNIILKGSYSVSGVRRCKAAGKFEVPSRIRITNCVAHGEQFANLVNDSEHDVVAPPESYNNDEDGVWVMGVGESVKVLNNEYLKI